jgi:hypothetical protein
VQENWDYANKIFQMRIKYALETSQRQILDAEKLRAIALGAQQGESDLVITAEIKKLTIESINKAEPVVKELASELIREYAKAITEVVAETVTAMVVAEIKKEMKEKP